MKSSKGHQEEEEEDYEEFGNKKEATTSANSKGVCLCVKVLFFK